MSIKRVDLVKIKNTKNKLQENSSERISFGTEENSSLPTAFPTYGEAQVHLNKISSIKADMNEFPQDIAYRKQLMTDAGKNSEDYYKIRSIVGREEIQSIMKEFHDCEDSYSVGVNDSNILNRTIRANLHIHTTTSDGFLSVQELLDKAAEHADKVVEAHPEFAKTPFTIAITDHDTVEGNREAIEIISANPEKYKNLRVILGAEMSMFNNIATDIVDHPTSNHTLVYGLNPYDKTFCNFITKVKEGKQKIAFVMINKANTVYNSNFNGNKDLFSLEEVQSFYSPVKKNILGTYNYIVRYVLAKTTVENVLLKNDFLVEQLKANGLPVDSVEIMKILQKYFYKKDRNVSLHTTTDLISIPLGEKLGMNPADIEAELKKGIKTEKFQKLYSKLKNSLTEYKISLSSKHPYVPNWDELKEGLADQPDAIIGMAHPLETIMQIDGYRKQKVFLYDMYKKFKDTFQRKAVFSEAYYQSYKGAIQEIKMNPETQKYMTQLSKFFKMFKTGSADSHRTNIFKRLY